MIMKVDLITTEDLEIFKENLLVEIKKIIKHDTVPNKNLEWLRSAEVRELLNISQGTLQNLRINGTLSYSMVGKIFYYKRENIISILEDNNLK